LQLSAALTGDVVAAASRTRRRTFWVVPFPSGASTVICVALGMVSTRAKVVGAELRETRSPTSRSFVKDVLVPLIVVVLFAVVVPAICVELVIVVGEKSQLDAAMRFPMVAGASGVSWETVVPLPRSQPYDTRSNGVPSVSCT
jgi:uncharacterized membrane protein YqjE